MYPDNIHPPPTHTVSREVLQLQYELEMLRLESRLPDTDENDAVPPPIRRQRPVFLDVSPSPSFSRPRARSLKPQITSVPPLPSRNPKRSRTEQSRAINFSHPFQDQSQSRPRYVDSASYRKSPLNRNNPRLPPSLRRWTSLETIDSVRTSASAPEEVSNRSPRESRSEVGIDGLDDAITEDAKLQASFYLDGDDEPLTENAPNTPTLLDPPVGLWKTLNFSNSSIHTASTSPASGSKRQSAASIVRKLRPGEPQEPLLTPESLEIKRTSFDQVSRSNSSNSIMTISSGHPSVFGSTSGVTSHTSQSNSEWKASDYDTSGLSQAKLKKCKKKGINPSLYAEMKAARKGKFISPIGGNSFI